MLDKALTSTAKCSHFVVSETYESYPDSGVFVINYTSATQTMLFGVTDMPIASESDFKAYLATQYANGNPVTVWYVLAEPEAAVVNEPLMKIGGYADTVSMAQAGVTIPTVQGTNVLDMVSPVKPSGVYVKGKGIRAIT